MRRLTVRRGAGAQGGTAVRVVVSAAAVAAVATVAQAVHGAMRLQRALRDAAGSRPFQMRPVRVAARLLIVGDSTAVGVGASSLRSGLAGLIARDHPGVAIVNRATVDADTPALLQQLAGDEPFDVVLLVAGGTDLLRLRGLGALRAAWQAAVASAQAVAPCVVVMPAPLPAAAFGARGALAWPWRWWMERRGWALQRVVAEVAAASGALHVNVSDAGGAAPVVLRGHALVAADGLHPNDTCYALWYEQLKAQARFSALLTRSHRLGQEQASAGPQA